MRGLFLQCVFPGIAISHSLLEYEPLEINESGLVEHAGTNASVGIGRRLVNTSCYTQGRVGRKPPNRVYIFYHVHECHVQCQFVKECHWFQWAEALGNCNLYFEKFPDNKRDAIQYAGYSSGKNVVGRKFCNVRSKEEIRISDVQRALEPSCAQLYGYVNFDDTKRLPGGPKNMDYVTWDYTRTVMLAQANYHGSLPAFWIRKNGIRSVKVAKPAGKVCTLTLRGTGPGQDDVFTQNNANVETPNGIRGYSCSCAPEPTTTTTTTPTPTTTTGKPTRAGLGQEEREVAPAAVPAAGEYLRGPQLFIPAAGVDSGDALQPMPLLAITNPKLTNSVGGVARQFVFICII